MIHCMPVTIYNALENQIIVLLLFFFVSTIKPIMSFNQMFNKKNVGIFRMLGPYLQRFLNLNSC